MTFRSLVTASAAILLLTPGLGLAREADFPTVDRVLYVQECLRAHPGPQFEMIHKCSCALDRVAAELSYDQYISLSTATNATSIGGERGSYIRESEGLQQEVRRYRALQAKAKKACFIAP